MKAGNSIVLPSHTVESWWKNRLVNVEPWAFGNGLLPDLQKLIICSQELANLFLYKTPIPLIIASYQIEPLVDSDLDAVIPPCFCRIYFRFSNFSMKSFRTPRKRVSLKVSYLGGAPGYNQSSF